MKRLLVAVILLLTCEATGQNISNVWALDDGERVQQDNNSHWYKTSTTNPVWKNGKINLFGVRNEVVAFQVVIEAGSNQALSVSAEQSTLTLQGGTSTISNTGWNGDIFNYVNRHIELFVADYIRVTARMPYFWSINGFNSAMPGPDSYYTGYIPDGLMPHEYRTTFNIAANQNQTVWGDIYIDRDQVAGVYNGTFTVKEQGITRYTIPVQLTVYDATLPDSTPWPMWYQSYEGHIAENLPVPFPPSTYADSVVLLNRMKKHAQMLHRHRTIQSFGSRFSYKELSDIEKFGGFYTGYAYSAAKGYDGPGQNVGDELCMIGTYNHLLAPTTALSGSLAPPNTPIQSTFVWGASNQTNVRYESNRWEQWFIDHAPNVYRVFYVQDEPFTPDWDMDGVTSDSHDTAAVFFVIRTFASWIRDNPGIGQNINTMSTGPYWDVTTGSTNSPARLDDETNNWITAQCETGVMWPQLGQAHGVHQRADTKGTYVNEATEEPCSGTSTGTNSSGSGVFTASMVWGQIRGIGTLQVDNGSGWDYYPYTAYSGGTFTLSGTLTKTYSAGTAVIAPWAEEWGVYSNISAKKAQGDKCFIYGGGWPAWGNPAVIDWPLSAGRMPPLVAMRYPNTIDGYFQYETLESYGMPVDMWNYTVTYANGTLGAMGEIGGSILYIGDSQKSGIQNLGVPGPIASIRLKSLRRGQQDAAYYQLARELGLADTMALRTVIPHALDDFDSSWPNGWNEIPMKVRSADYETMRLTLAQAIDGGIVTPPPSATLTSNDYDLSGAGTVTLTWSSSGATDGVISPQASGDIGDSLVGTSGNGSFYVAQSQTYTYKAFNTLGDTGYAYANIVVGATAPELITNGDFESASGWTSYDNSPSPGSYQRVTGDYHGGSYSWESDLPDAYSGTANVQSYVESGYTFPLTGGKTYTLSMWVKGSTNTSVRVRVLQKGGSYTNYGVDTVISITTGWAQITKTFICTATGSVSDGYLQFLNALSNTAWSVANATLWYDDISLKEQSPTALSAPTLTLPALYATQVDTPTVFNWTAVSGAESYHLQVDNNNDFLSLTHVDSGLTVLADTTGVGVLASGVTYYWRVRAKNALGIGPWGGGSGQYFNTVSTAPATAPIIVFPLWNQYHVQLNPIFYWNTSVGAVYYLFELTSDSVNGVRDTAYVSNPSIGVGTGGNHPSLTPSTQYFWRVTAYNSLGVGASTYWTPFVTGSRVGLSTKKILRTR